MHACQHDDQARRAGHPISSRSRAHATLVAELSRLGMASATLTKSASLCTLHGYKHCICMICRLKSTTRLQAKEHHRMTIGHRIPCHSGPVHGRQKKRTLCPLDCTQLHSLSFLCAPLPLFCCLCSPLSSVSYRIMRCSRIVLLLGSPRRLSSALRWSLFPLPPPPPA